MLFFTSIERKSKFPEGTLEAIEHIGLKIHHYGTFNAFVFISE